MSSTQFHSTTLSTALLLSALTSVTGAMQQEVQSPYPMKLRHSGEIREIEVVHDSGDTHVWTTEDGGRIRYSDDPSDPASWEFQGTPADVAQTLLNIRFSDPLNGWACGRAGHILMTDDGGTTWEHSHPTDNVLHDSTTTARPGATVWSIDWATPQIGFAVGIWTFRRASSATSGLSTWENVTMQRSYGSTAFYRPRDMEMYDVRILHDNTEPGRWVGLAVGEADSSDLEPAGIVFYTDSTDSNSNGGRNWWPIFKSVHNGDEDFMKDPWELEFDSYEGDVDNLNGYMVGGHSTGRGFMFSTTDGGQTWTNETPSTPVPDELYGVAAMGGGRAMAVGYQGNVWKRRPGIGWVEAPITLPQPNGINTRPKIETPIAAIEGTGTAAILGGSFGVFRETLDYGISYEYRNPVYGDPAGSNIGPESDWRPEDVHFFDDLNGFAVGQHQLIVRTSDGGLSWVKQNGGWDDANCPNGPTCIQSPFRAVDFRNQNIGVAISHSGGQGATHFMRTTNGGATWTAASDSLANNVRLTDVEHAGGSTFWACGHQNGVGPHILRSTNNAATWISLGAPGTIDFEPTAMTFLAPKRGFVVGTTDGVPTAFRIREIISPIGGGTPYITWDDVSPTDVGVVDVLEGGNDAQGLLDVDSFGTAYHNAKVVTVGQNGIAFEYDFASNRFDDSLQDIYDVQEGTTNVLTLEMPMNLSAVSVSPSGNSVLIGVEPWGGQPIPGTSGAALTLPHEDVGYALFVDNVGVERIKALTNDAIDAVQLVSDSMGIVLSRSSGFTINSELGTVGDYTFLALDMP